MKNKKGQITLLLIFFIIAALVTMVSLGVGSWGLGIVDEQLRSIDFEVGNVSWNETYNQSLGRGLQTATNDSAKIMSLGILIGMIIVMMLIGYYSPERGHLWIILDIGVIIVAEIIAGVVVSSFQSLMNIHPSLFDIFSNNLSEGSKFILSLPIIVPVVGVLMMIMTNIVNKIKKKEELVRF